MGKVTSHINSSEMLSSIDLINQSRGVNADIASLNSQMADKASQDYVYDKLPLFTQWKDLVFGREHLIAFHNKVGQGNGAKIVFSGDSTTDGYAVQSPEWYIDQTVKKALDYNGFSTISVVKRGQSGMSTEHWNRTYVSGDIAENPDLLVLRWGINDPSYDINLNHLADDGQNYNIRRNAQNFKDSLYAGLQQIRNTKSYSDCSILLMTPNSTSDDLSFRNEKWHEEINGIIRVAARQFNCTFIDTYRLWEDSRNATGFMDIINQGHIHPLAMMNLWIADVIYQTIIPQLYRDYYNDFNKEKLVDPSNSWVNYGGVFTSLGYVKENYKKIRLQGWLHDGTRTQGTIIGTFPAPSKQQNIKGAAETGEAAFYVETSGAVKIWSVPATGWICLDGGTYLL